MISGPVARLISGVALIGIILFGQTVYGAATASGRIDEALRHPAGPSAVVVVLDFTPERFHNERLASYGVFSGRDGAVGRIRLRNVSPGNLAALSRLAWVSRIEPIRPPVRAP
jgi:hypothetical protein